MPIGHTELARVRARVWHSVLGMLTFGVLLLGALQLLRNNVPPHGIDWGHLRLATGLSPADATVAVYASVTLTAALTVALAAAAAAESVLTREDRRHRAAGAVWSQVTAFSSCAFSTLALTAALTQFFNEAPERGMAQPVLLLLTAMFGICLAAALTTWSGQDTVHEAELEREKEHLLAVGRRWATRRPEERSLVPALQARVVLAALVAIATVGLIAVESAALPGPVLRLQDEHSSAWWAIVAGLPLLLSTVTCELYMSDDKTTLESQRVVRWLSLIPAVTMPATYVVLVLAALPASRSTTSGVQIASLFLVPCAMTLWLLVRGRTRSSSLGRFVTDSGLLRLHQRLVATGERERRTG